MSDVYTWLSAHWTDPAVVGIAGFLAYEARQWRIAVQRKWFGGAPDAKP